MKILDRYIMRQFLLGMFPVVLLLLILFSFLALAEELERVGEGVFTQFDAFMVVLNTAPRRIVDLLPVSTLLGGLMGLGAMASHQELIAARAAGMSRLRIAWPVFVVSLILAGMVILTQSLLIPLAERQASELRAKSLHETNLESGADLEFWARAGNNFVRVNDVRYGQLLSNVEIYLTDESGRLQQVIQASQASIAGLNDWMLSDVTLTTLDGLVSHEEKRDSLSWPALLSAEQASILMLPLEALAPYELSRLIDFQRANGLDTQQHRVIFWQQISISLAIVGMGLLTLPLLLGSIRSIPAGQRVVIGGFIGISFYLVQQLTGHLAGLFDLHPPSTLLAPAIILLAVAVYAQFLDDARRRKARRRAETRLRQLAG